MFNLELSVNHGDNHDDHQASVSSENLSCQTHTSTCVRASLACNTYVDIARKNVQLLQLLTACLQLYCRVKTRLLKDGRDCFQATHIKTSVCRTF